MLGLYIHVPFCAGKCPYCDFYSLTPSEDLVSRYAARLTELLAQWAPRCPRPLTSVYFGGGTPSLLGGAGLSALLEAVSRHFALAPGAEVTCEANPTDLQPGFFRELRAGGFNRLSMGLQSANEDELRFLGRRHSPGDVRRTVELARAAGFGNISLDLMLALPGSSLEALGRSVEFAASLEPQHISSYILKVEPGTPFARQGVPQPDPDQAADEYLFCVKALAQRGYAQYEISNFARPGYESRHNLTYWRCEEYLGLGPGAHSFLNGRRFYWERDLEGFLRGNGPVDDGPGGDFQEFAMLALRLTEGLALVPCRERFGPQGEELFAQIRDKARRLPARLVRLGEERVALTPEGFLVSNAILGELLPASTQTS